MWFEQIFGQHYAVELFKKAFENNRVAQSYLFFGPEGVGKKTFAITLSMAIQCEQGFGVGCGICISCKKVLHGSHADLVLVQPLEGKSTISIDQVRQLPSIMYRKPQEGRRRVVIIDSMEFLEDEAQNALLKILEEPPQDNVMILLTQKIQQILPTIASRCQPVRFQTLSASDIEKIIRKRILGDSIPKAVMTLSRGSAAEAIRILEDENFIEHWNSLRDWFFQEEKWTEIDRTEWISQREKENWSRDDFLLFWETWQIFLRDCLIITVKGNTSLLDFPHLLEQYQRMKPKSASVITNRLYEIERAIFRLKNRGNGPMITEAILMNWRRDIDAERSRRAL